MTEMKQTAAGWLRAHVDYQLDFCLVYPYARNPNGYAQLNFEGRKGVWAHRIMCELANGEQPTPEHVASHSCGNGDIGCCNPRHLRWSTPLENRRDSIEHGTSVRARRGRQARLSQEQVEEIWALKGRLNQQDVADRFGISPPMVRAIYTGKAYGKPPKVQYWKPEEDEVLRAGLLDGLTQEQIAERVGRTKGGINRRVQTLRLTRVRDASQ